MNKLLVLLILVCGCSYSNGNPQTTTPTIDHSKDPAWQYHGDDINWTVESGWKPGKEFPITQSLKPNTITKEKSNGDTDNNSR